MYGVKATFVYSVLTSFVKKDIEILNNMNVSLYQIRSHPYKDFFNFFTNRLKELLKSILFIPKSQMVICWFCDYHGLIPLLKYVNFQGGRNHLILNESIWFGSWFECRNSLMKTKFENRKIKNINISKIKRVIT